MKKIEGVPALVLCALLWSSGGILIKLVEWNPFAIAAARSLVAGLFISLLLRRKPFFAVRKSQENNPVDARATLNLWLAGICYALTMIFYVLGNKMTTAANTILLEYTSPVYIILFGPLILKEKNKLWDYISVVVVMAGMSLFFSEGLESGNMAGNIIAALSGFSFGFCTMFMRNQDSDRSINSFLLAHLITFLVCVPFAFISGFPSALSCAGLVLLGIFQSGTPSVLYSLGLKKVRALTATFISMIEPLMNPVWVMLFAGEIPSWQCIAGGLMILGCIGIRAVLSHR
ncbi:MAG: EamA family transporter [Treponema sp.]|nr:EamA family transporter [Treponema sp.]